MSTLGLNNGLSISSGGGSALEKLYKDKILSYNPVLYYPMDETEGTQATDYSGNGLHGIYNTLTVGQTQAPFTCVLFDNVNGHRIQSTAGVLAGLNSRMVRTEGTIFAYAKALDATVWTEVSAFSKYFCDMSGTSERFFLWKHNIPANQLRCYTRLNNTNKEAAITVPTDYLDWFHVAMTWKNSTPNNTFVYFNGTPSTAQTNIGTPNMNAWTKFNVGGDENGNNTWKGWMAHFAIFNQYMTQETIQTIMNYEDL